VNRRVLTDGKAVGDGVFGGGRGGAYGLEDERKEKQAFSKEDKREENSRLGLLFFRPC
jgi:hypothetical protein